MQCGMCKYLSNISWGHVCYFLEDVLAVGPTYNKYMGTICVLWIMFYMTSQNVSYGIPIREGNSTTSF